MCDFFNPNLGLNVIPVNQRAAPYKKIKRVSLELAESRIICLLLEITMTAVKNVLNFLLMWWELVKL